MSQDPHRAAPSYIELDAANFRSEIDGKSVELYEIRNRRGMVVRLTNFGARIVQLIVPDREGRLGDVAQGYATIGEILTGQPSMGAFIGRYANRIGNGRFSLDDVDYALSINDLATAPAPPRQNCLHGGTKGSRFRVFDAIQRGPDAVQMKLVFADGEEGFPGELRLSVVYRVSEDNALHIDYAATAGARKTVGSFTSHVFWNLSGDLGSSIEDHVLTVAADEVLEVGPALVPTGRLRKVAATPMDFRAGKALGADIDADYDLLRAGNGYDNHYVVAPAAQAEPVFHARIEDPKSGRAMEVWATEPGLQLCSGNVLTGQAPRDVGKGGTPYPFRSAFFLEPSHFPDSPNHPDFPTTVIEAGATYRGTIIYRFSAR